LSAPPRCPASPDGVVYGFFAHGGKNGVLEYVRDQPRRQIRVDAGRCARPVTSIIDSQSVKAVETVSPDTRPVGEPQRPCAARRPALRRLDTTGVTITFETVAREAGVSRSSDVSLLRRREAAAEHNRQLEAEEPSVNGRLSLLRSGNDGQRPCRGDLKAPRAQRDAM
jgi:hypothetical protein